MPMVKSFTQAQWDAASRRLDTLPEKPAHEHRVNVRDAIKSMQAQISSAQKKGYTLEEIVHQLAQDGVEISASTLRYAMQRAAKESRPVQAEGTAVQGATTAARVKKGSQERSSDAGNKAAGKTQDGGTAVSQQGSMVIRDAFSFEITPDVENL
jgi:predicted alpha/beta-hydrolase family hydrolase